ncbi:MULTISPECIES: hypothetical protein [Actinoplanes]|uniref:hypothetical protein n=1 Tax=Actinoplanes TaxID=1865 RepID=UPI0005F2FA99|nr:MULTISPECIES: hypothetical protein [Actinoplanes]GLY04179.1 hypothetical protein Acsp01_45580 [Actinoplanes sp. NBRC 101535]
MGAVSWVTAVAQLFLAVGLVMLAVSGRQRARQRLDRRLMVVDRKLDTIMRHLGIVEPEAEYPEVVGLLVTGDRIQAIKVYRERTGVSLADAKRDVERLEREYFTRTPERP